MNDTLKALQKIIFKVERYYDTLTGEVFFVVNGGDTRMN